jgi:hypothetical protein
VNQRQAMREAHAIVEALIYGQLAGPHIEFADNDADETRIEKALELLGDQHRRKAAK